MSCQSRYAGEAGVKVRMGKGKQVVIDEYESQARLRQPIYFVASRADRPFMGFESIHSVRMLQGKLSPGRYGITPDAPEAPINPEIDKRSRLTRTWIDEKDYTAPVEWSVSGDSLLIQIFDGDGQTIVIQDGLVAESFRQLWHLMNKALRGAEKYAALPLKAKRAV